MTKHNIYIDKLDWLIRVFIGVNEIDTNEVVDTLYSFGCSDEEASVARINLRGNKNNGICYNNREERISVLVIGKTNSAREFLDSLVHETMHLAINIATEDGINLRSEDVCYIGGDVARELYPYCKEYLCCHCHK